VPEFNAASVQRRLDREQVTPTCPRCKGPAQVIDTWLPTAAFRLGPQTSAMRRPAVLVECVDQEDCRWANEVLDLLDLARHGRKTAFMPAPDLTTQVATVREFGQERGLDHA
jgi:hypothetical protein